MLERASATHIAASTESVLPSWEGRIRNACVFTNIARTRPDFAKSMQDHVYTKRSVNIDGVSLCRLPMGTILTGGHEYLVQIGDCLLEEQIPPYIRSNDFKIQQLLGNCEDRDRIIHVREECLLVARFGLITWGHWLGELLPKIILAETHCPGRFRFILPSEVVDFRGKHPSYGAIWDSLVAHGLDQNRILPVDITKRHVFDALYCLTPVWSDHSMHPEVMRMMRDAIPFQGSETRRRIALLRTDAPGRRQIANYEPVVGLLEALGYEAGAPGSIPFLEQVALFRSASDIVSVLGSGLTGLIYAPSGVRVLAVAPDVFGDRFFYALTVLRNGFWADVRGPVHEKHERIEHQSSFLLDLEDIKQGLSALSAHPGSSDSC